MTLLDQHPFMELTTNTVPLSESLVYACALQFGWELHSELGLQRDARPDKNDKRPMRIPLQPLQLTTQVEKAAESVKQDFHAQEAPRIDPPIIREHANLYHKWHKQRYGKITIQNVRNMLSNITSRENARILSMRSQHFSLMAGALYTPIDVGGRPDCVYVDRAYYNPDLITKPGLAAQWDVKKPGLGVLGRLMQMHHLQGYQYMYVGSWSPQRGHPYFYKMNLARNTQIYDQQQWVDARQYRKSLKP